MNESIVRLISGIVYVSLLVFATFNFESFYVLFGVFAVIAAFEFSKLIKIQPVIASVFCALCMFGNYYIIQNAYIEYTLLTIALIVSFMLVSMLFTRNDENKDIDLVSKWILLVGYIILPFICITKIPIGNDGYNQKIILSIFILIWTNDTFAYIVGKSIGKHKLLEKISPKKTIEGFLGGMIFSIIAGVLISKYYFIPKPHYQKTSIIIWSVIAILVSVFGTVGDLIESKFKRQAGVKDSGKIMPGHGGILDRLDSLIFVAPFVFLFYQILSYFK